MLKKINYTYFAIIFAILGSFLVTEYMVANDSIFIALFSTLKFLLIGFIFMEVFKAHQVWKALLVLFMIIYLITILVFY